MKLGNPNGAEALRRAGKGAVALRAAVSVNARQFAEELEPVIADMRAMAAELNRRGMRTRRGGAWQVSNVRNLVGRASTRVVGARMLPELPDQIPADKSHRLDQATKYL